MVPSAPAEHHASQTVVQQSWPSRVKMTVKAPLLSSAKGLSTGTVAQLRCARGGPLLRVRRAPRCSSSPRASPVALARSSNPNHGASTDVLTRRTRVTFPWFADWWSSEVVHMPRPDSQARAAGRETGAPIVDTACP